MSRQRPSEGDLISFLPCESSVVKSDICTCSFTAACSPWLSSSTYTWQLELCLLPPTEGSDFCPCCYSQNGRIKLKNWRKQLLIQWDSLVDAPAAHGPEVTISTKGEKGTGREGNQRKGDKAGKERQKNHKELEHRRGRGKGEKNITDKRSFLLNCECECGSPTSCASALTSEHLWSACRSFLIWVLYLLKGYISWRPEQQD